MSYKQDHPTFKLVIWCWYEIKICVTKTVKEDT